MSAPTIEQRRKALSAYGIRVKPDASGGFGSPREFLSCVVAACCGDPLDPRLAKLRTASTGQLLRKVGATAGSDEQQTQANQYGGFLVPSGLIPGFLSTTVEDDPIGGRVLAVEMPFPVTRVPARVDENHNTSVAGGVTVSRRMETDLIDTSLLQMREIVLRANGLYGAAFASQELMMDSRQAFAAVLSAAFQDEIKGQLINERLYGTGAGQFLGVLNSGCLVTVPKDNSQPTGTISATNVTGMRSRCWGYNNAVWLANHNSYEQIATLTLGTGTAVTQLFVPTNREGDPDMLASRPIIFTEYCQPLGDVGDIVLGNWSQYLEGTLQTGSDSSLHVRFIQHEACFKFWIRNDGSPWWRVPLTPLGSLATLSPFVTLAARP
jgi:HK97 family phage major capsid protein